jgi:hypothetical protein
VRITSQRRELYLSAQILASLGLAWTTGFGPLWGDAASHGPAVGAVAQSEAYSARLTAARAITRPGHGTNWEYTFEVQNRTTHAASTLHFGGADQAVEDELEWFGVVGDRLFVTAAFEIRVFSLATQKTEKEIVVASPVPSPDGTKIAYLVLHPRFTANEDSGSIVAVLDLATLAYRYVFPEPDRVDEIHNGSNVYPVVTEADPAKQHQVLKLFWAPDGKRLVFFCSHGFPLHPQVGPMYVVVVDVHQFLTGTRFVHQPVDGSCGSRLCLMTTTGPIMKTVANKCGGCHDGHHFDNFSAATQCGLLDNLPGQFPTLQLYDN